MRYIIQYLKWLFSEESQEPKTQEPEQSLPAHLLTQTATELMNDPEFWKMRFYQQEEYIISVLISDRSLERKDELCEKARSIKRTCLYNHARLMSGLEVEVVSKESWQKLLNKI